jgi:hypothetical protein
MPVPKGTRIGGRKKGSRNKIAADVRELAQKYTADAIATLADVMRDKTAPPQARAMAAEKLLDRAWGKAPQSITGPNGGPIPIILYTDDAGL